MRIAEIAKRACVTAIAMLLILGCQGNKKEGDHGKLSRQEALELAVELANERCLASFDREPFEAGDAKIALEDGKWCWGEEGEATSHGFSAIVSFDEEGGSPKVEVAFSDDAVPALY